MPKGVATNRLLVCVVGDNKLAAEYLVSLLARNGTIHPSTLEDFKAGRNAGGICPIFVLDNGGLSLPLSECLRRLRVVYPGARFIVLDKQQSKEDIIRLLWYDIHGFVSFADVRKKLLRAVCSVSRGRRWISAELLTTYLRVRRRARTAAGKRRMTPRENEIKELVQRRFSNKEIASILRICESTVKFHLTNIFRKLHAEGREELLQQEQAADGLAAFLLRSQTQLGQTGKT